MSSNFWAYEAAQKVLFVCNRGVTAQYHGCLQSRELGQAPMLLMFLTPKQALSSHPRLVHYQSSYNTAQAWWNPLLLADGTLLCRMYPTGKVAISQHLATPGVPSVTISEKDRKSSINIHSLCDSFIRMSKAENCFGRLCLSPTAN